MMIFGEKKIKNFLTANIFSNRSNKWPQIVFCFMSAVKLVGLKIIYVHVKALGMRMQKLVLGLSLTQIPTSSENERNAFPK